MEHSDTEPQEAGGPDEHHGDESALAPPVPDEFSFDYFQHEYWKLAQLYRELAHWESDLYRREEELQRRNQQHHRRGGGRRSYGRGGPRSNAPPSLPPSQ